LGDDNLFALAREGVLGVDQVQQLDGQLLAPRLLRVQIAQNLFEGASGVTKGAFHVEDADENHVVFACKPVPGTPVRARNLLKLARNLLKVRRPVSFLGDDHTSLPRQTE